jgi:putrescine transport system ATP-binding protein
LAARAPDPSPPRLRLEDLTKRFGAHTAVESVSLELDPGAFFCLLGPSGCGKSTLLRMIAGFERPSAGRVLLGDQDLTALPPHRRPVNMMFQSYALFPHMSVAGNVGYGLTGLGRAAAAARVQELLRLVRLEGFSDRRPGTLSGGQRQRVALARALAREPKLLLLDEPLGALDRGLREETQGELRAVQRRLGTAFVVVTHDPEEAMMLADRIGVMDSGRLVQVGPPATLYRRPATRFVAGLLGDVNLIPGRLGVEGPGDTRSVQTAFGPVQGVATAPLAEGDAVVVAVRPEDLVVGGEGLPVKVADVTFLGDRVRRTLHLPDGTVLRASARPTDADRPAGLETRAGFAAEAAVILPA